MKQPPEVLVCQKCGRVAPNLPPESNDWLVSLRRDGSGVWIVRCPQHISEWALRQSYAGRTGAMRERARRGASKPPPPLVGLEPMPVRARGAGG